MQDFLLHIPFSKHSYSLAGTSCTLSKITTNYCCCCSLERVPRIATGKFPVCSVGCVLTCLVGCVLICFFKNSTRNTAVYDSTQTSRALVHLAYHVTRWQHLHEANVVGDDVDTGRSVQLSLDDVTRDGHVRLNEHGQQAREVGGDTRHSGSARPVKNERMLLVGCGCPGNTKDLRVNSDENKSGQTSVLF